MTVPRMIILLCLFGLLSMVVLVLRADQVRRSHRIQQVQLKQIDLERTCWTQQLEIARLRSPDQVRARNKRVDAPLTPPYEAPSVLPPHEAWLADD